LFQLDGFLTRKLGKFIFKGKTKPVAVYEVLGRMEETSEQQKMLCEVFENGLRAFRKQYWKEAIDIFAESLKTYRADGPSIFYLQLSETYRKEPPVGTWEGWVRLDKK
jgi:adenylate cyclase